MEAWIRIDDDSSGDGETYYMNSETKERTKVPPVNLWEEHHTEEGEAYYFHPLSRETTWDPPAGITAHGKQGEKKNEDNMPLAEEDVQRIVEDDELRLSVRRFVHSHEIRNPRRIKHADALRNIAGENLVPSDPVFWPAKKADDYSNVSHRARLIEFYKKHNPSKLGDVDATLKKFGGREDLLFAKLEKKYCQKRPAIQSKKGETPPQVTSKKRLENETRKIVHEQGRTRSVEKSRARNEREAKHRVDERQEEARKKALEKVRRREEEKRNSRQSLPLPGKKRISAAKGKALRLAENPPRIRLCISCGMAFPASQIEQHVRLCKVSYGEHLELAREKRRITQQQAAHSAANKMRAFERQIASAKNAAAAKYIQRSFRRYRALIMARKRAKKIAIQCQGRRCMNDVAKDLCERIFLLREKTAMVHQERKNESAIAESIAAYKTKVDIQRLESELRKSHEVHLCNIAELKRNTAEARSRKRSLHTEVLHSHFLRDKAINALAEVNGITRSLSEEITEIEDALAASKRGIDSARQSVRKSVSTELEYLRKSLHSVKHQVDSESNL
eukprot:g5300.t1